MHNLRYSIDLAKNQSWEKEFVLLKNEISISVTEFGAGIKYPPPNSLYQGFDLWQDANAFLYTCLNSAILYGAQQSSGEGWDNCTAAEQMHPQAGVRRQPQFTWGAAVAMDCGDPVYADFLTEQCRRHGGDHNEKKGMMH